MVDPNVAEYCLEATKVGEEKLVYSRTIAYVTALFQLVTKQPPLLLLSLAPVLRTNNVAKLTVFTMTTIESILVEEVLVAHGTKFHEH